MTKHVIVTGGVVSGLGKGITAASLARLFKCRGLSVVLGKMDPYLNVDPGTLAPGEHGETFVLEGGKEVDLDFGHYERFADTELPGTATITAGAVFLDVLSRERRGDYLGETVQVVPHIVDAIRDRMLALSEPVRGHAPDVVILELGGTVGDLESLPFLEAIRRYRKAVGRNNFCLVHLALVPTITTSGEEKTKPVQHSVTELRARGLSADVIVLRARRALGPALKTKISNLCDVEVEAVISARDCDSLYEVPLALHEEGLDTVVTQVLGLEERAVDLTHWQELTRRSLLAEPAVRVAVVGKYTHPDAYLSVVESLKHAAMSERAAVAVDCLSAEDFVDGDVEAKLKDYDAVVIPGGFGERGVEGKVVVAQATRTLGVPTLGICLGMQVMVIEAARNLLGLQDANSAEFDDQSQHCVVSLMPDQEELDDLGGTMRLGGYECSLVPGSRAWSAYGSDSAVERHRHRYEVVNAYRASLAEGGLTVSGTSPDGRLVEVVEVADHPFYVGTQAHPEFLSRPDRPHPLFTALVQAALRARQ